MAGRQPGEQRRREGKRRLNLRHAGRRSRREVEGGCVTRDSRGRGQGGLERKGGTQPRGERGDKKQGGLTPETLLPMPCVTLGDGSDTSVKLTVFLLPLTWW